MCHHHTWRMQCWGPPQDWSMLGKRSTNNVRGSACNSVVLSAITGFSGSECIHRVLQLLLNSEHFITHHKKKPSVGMMDHAFNPNAQGPEGGRSEFQGSLTHILYNKTLYQKPKGGKWRNLPPFSVVTTNLCCLFSPSPVHAGPNFFFIYSDMSPKWNDVCVCSVVLCECFTCEHHS